MTILSIYPEPIVITGIGLVASVGMRRESVWQAVRGGKSRFGFIRGLPGIPDGEFVGAVVELDEPLRGRHKVIPLCQRAAAEAIDDSGLDLERIDRERFGCAIAGHMTHPGWFHQEVLGQRVTGPDAVSWWEQALPNSACSTVARSFDLRGPRLCNSTACASSLISFLTAARSIRDNQCDMALVGGGDVIDPLFVAGFNRMRVLARDVDPNRACRPFDVTRKGMVFGEGSAMFVIERLGHALRRRAKIYAQIAGIAAAAQAHHVTGLDADSGTLVHLIQEVLAKARLEPEEIGYINAHGTGTEQNDAAEAHGISRAFGASASSLCVSSTKSILGHLVHGAGAVELAITALALRDGFVPPTLNLNEPDPACRFDCLPWVGRARKVQHAVKLSLAFGGHFVAVALSRWNDSATGHAYPALAKAA